MMLSTYFASLSTMTLNKLRNACRFSDDVLTFLGGFPKGFREQRNIGKISKWTRDHERIFKGNGGTKLYKVENEQIVRKFLKWGTNKENVWEHGNIELFSIRSRLRDRIVINISSDDENMRTARKRKSTAERKKRRRQWDNKETKKKKGRRKKEEKKKQK